MGYISAVTQNGTKIRINEAKEINRGGEGVIYELGQDFVAKIYHPGIEPIKLDKFEFLRKLDKNLFVPPLELLFDSKSNIIGYTMPYLNSEYYPLSNLFVKSFCTANGVDKKVKLIIFENLIKAVEYAHQMKIVIGDLNCFNVMVNNQGSIKLIDTDSYQTPGFVHSGRLLEEIRDYYYQGKIDSNSDFFALSIMFFNMLAFLHPFKGIHKTYMKMSDRMIHKIPVFLNDPGLKIPKCYEPINDSNLLGQFERFYLKGERFLMSLSNVNANMIIVKANQPSAVKSYEKNDLIITMLLADKEIKNINCRENRMVLETEDDFYIYDTKNPGYVNLLDTISKKNYSQVFIGDQNIILKKGNELFLHQGINKISKITSFQVPDQTLFGKQYENILVIVDHDKMYKIFLDEVIAGTIRLTTLEVFGKGFQKNNSLLWNVGGKQNVFYNESGKEMAIVNLPTRIQDLYQERNLGMIQYIEKKQVKYKLFKIKDNKLNIAQDEFPGWNHFTCRMDKTGEGLIFAPVDDGIKIMRTQDFAQVGELKCDLVSSESVLKNTKSGLVLLENGKAWLLNKK